MIARVANSALDAAVRHKLITTECDQSTGANHLVFFDQNRIAVVQRIELYITEALVTAGEFIAGYADPSEDDDAYVNVGVNIPITLEIGDIHPVVTTPFEVPAGKFFMVGHEQISADGQWYICVQWVWKDASDETPTLGV